jgi:hypothetical protein
LSIQQIMRDRALAIVACGFTERQARFFVTVMLHSDVFVERPYCAFANIGHGQKTTDFLRSSWTELLRPRLRPAGSPRTAHPRALQAAVRGRIFRARDAQLLLALPECGRPW